MLKKALGVVVVFAAFGALIWGSDRITMQGERTIFLVDCKNGAWQGSHCTGKLVASERHAFRASMRRHEVIYWTRGSQSPSGRFSDCTVVDRDNWFCNVHTDQQPSITFEMKNGKPTHGGLGLVLPFHDVPKWKWWLMDMGIDLFSDANE